MSDKSGGFFSSVGRFFSVGSVSKTKEDEQSVNSSKSEEVVRNTFSESPTASTAAPAEFLKNIVAVNSNGPSDSDEAPVDTAQNSRTESRLRYLSPSVLIQRAGKVSDALEIDVDPVSDIFFSTPSISTTRKRQLTELDKQALPQSFRSDNVKRSRFLNRSLLEPTLKSTLGGDKKMDMSWCGELTANHSPASSITNFSLLSRRSGATTNGSLSTRTQEIFKKLEGASTPAKEVQRMPMLRAGLVRPEQWAHTNGSREYGASSILTPPPPLKKAGDSIPSRIQLISKSMGISARRAPYWTDLTRKRTTSKNGDYSSDTSSLRSLNGTLASAELSSVFSLEPAPKKIATAESTASTNTMNSFNSRKHASILKGPDGKPVGRNTFKLSDEIDDDNEECQRLPSIPETVLINPQPLKLSPESAPKRGFLNNVSFTFTAPIDVVSAIETAKSTGVTSSNRSSVSNGDCSAESTEKQTSDSSESESSVSGDSDSEVEVNDENGEEVKESRPQTSADTITSAEGSHQSTQSSKDSSPKVAKEAKIASTMAVETAAAGSAKWECQTCFCSWDKSLTKCGACGEPQPGTAAIQNNQQNPTEKQLVSNLASFAPSKPSNFKFGFGGGASTAAPASSEVPTGAAFGNKSSVPFNVKFGVVGGVSTTAPISSAVSTEVALGNKSSVPANDKPTPLVFGAPKIDTPLSGVISKPAVVSLSVPTTVVTPVLPSAASTSSEPVRVDWECPDCMVKNKASDDKCPCCSHVKYASSGASSSNVFGNRAFKPAPVSGPAINFGVSGGSSSNPVSFGFGSSKTAEIAPATTTPVAPGTTSSFVFSEKPITSAPVVTTTPLEPAKQSVSTFGSLIKPADSTAAVIANPGLTAAPTTSSRTPIFENIFGVKPSSQESSKPSMFGSILNKETPTTTTPAAPSLASVPGGQAPLPIFNSTSSTPFGGSTFFGGSKPVTEVPSTLSFGTSTSAPTSTTTNETLKTSLFGNISVAPPALSSKTSLFPSESSTKSPFSNTPADSTTSSTIFGKQVQFRGEVGTTTSDGGVPTKRGLFSTDAPKLSFGGDQQTELPKFVGFGGSSAAATTTASSLFGGSSTTSSIFGNQPSKNVPAFSSTNSTNIPAFGNTSTVPFNSAVTTTTSGPFGAFGSKPVQPGLSASSSTNSVFSQGLADSSNPFGNTSSNGFTFGTTNSSSSTGGGVFQFGSTAPSAPAPSAAPVGTFQFGNNLAVPQPPAPGSMDNAFAYQAPSGVGSRKMAIGRRRNVRK